MTPEQIGILGIPALVTAFVLWLLNRRGTNRHLDVEQATLGANISDQQMRRFQYLLEHSEKSAVEMAAKIALLEARVVQLEVADASKSHEIEDANTKIERLRELFQSYVDRTGIPLTPDEQATFEQTTPSPRIRKQS